MDPSSGPRDRKPSQNPSWANVVSNKSPDGKHDNVAASTSVKSGRATFTSRGGKNGSNYKNGQRFQQSRFSHPPNSASPAIAVSTFRDQYLQQIQASEQPANPRPQASKPPAVPAQDMQATARLNTEVASLQATVATLNDDLSRRSSDLIQAKTDLAVKDSEIESLKNTIAMLNQKLESTTVADKENHAKFTAQDNTIKKLQYENASLRDAIHTGVISIAQIYGPGSTQAFTEIASKEADTIEQATKGYTSGRRNVRPTQPSPSNSLYVPKKNGSSSHEQPTRNSHADEAPKKAQKQSRHARQVVIPVSKGDDHSAKVGLSVKTDHSVKEVDILGEETHPVAEENHIPVGDHPTIEEVRPPIQSDDSSTEKNVVIGSNVDATPDHHDAPAAECSDTSAKDVDVGDSPLPETHEPSTTQMQDSDLIDLVEKGGDANPSSPQVNDDAPTVEGHVDPASGKYAFKGQESVDLGMHGAIGTNADDAKTMAPLSKDEDGTLINDTSQSYWRARTNSETEDPRSLTKTVAAAAATDGSRLMSLFANGTSFVLLHQKATESKSENQSSILPAEQTDDNNEQPMKSDDGWVNVPAKSRPNYKAKAKAKAKAKKKAELTENQSPEPKANNNVPKVTKPVPREKGVPAKAQKRWAQKHNGTVIGSNSVFSQATNKQQSGQDSGKEKEEPRKSPGGSSSYDKKQENASSPPRDGPNSRKSPVRKTNGGRKSQAGTPKTAGSKMDSDRPTGMSWADEMDEVDAKLQQTF
ncbi:hypothetical protein F5Y13DRAFT_197451 [Hypoxylon sp. FL1857]|nr:hypothetical protein F5Y13DRAFT_197451 [Hypoxylon sp. FL1857]